MAEPEIFGVFKILDRLPTCLHMMLPRQCFIKRPEVEDSQSQNQGNGHRHFFEGIPACRDAHRNGPGFAHLVDADHVHAAAKCILGDSGADAAEPDDAEGLAAKLDALGISLLEHLELVCATLRHGRVALVQGAGHGEQVRHHQFRDALGAGRRSVEDHLSMGTGVLDVNVVHADSTASDEAEVRASINEVLADLGGAGCSLLGDANEDSQINVLDVVLTVNLILSPNGQDNLCSDINGDNQLNVLDVVSLVNLILGRN